MAGAGAASLSRVAADEEPSNPGQVMHLPGASFKREESGSLSAGCISAYACLAATWMTFGFAASAFGMTRVSRPFS